MARNPRSMSGNSRADKAATAAYGKRADVQAKKDPGAGYAQQAAKHDAALRKDPSNSYHKEMSATLHKEAAAARASHSSNQANSKSSVAGSNAKSHASESKGGGGGDEYKRDDLAAIEGRDALLKAQLATKVYEEFEYHRSEKEKRSAVYEATSSLERDGRKNESELASKRANLENRKRQLSIREVRLKKLLEQMENTTLKAPSDGLVVYATSMNQGWSFGGEGPLQIGRKTYPNELLISLLEGLWDKADRYRRAALESREDSPDDRARVQAEHQAMMKAVLDGDPDAAEEQVRRHVANSLGRRAIDLLADAATTGD
jgi:hypothetical protein